MDIYIWIVCIYDIDDGGSYIESVIMKEMNIITKIAGIGVLMNVCLFISCSPYNINNLFIELMIRVIAYFVMVICALELFKYFVYTLASFDKGDEKQ